MRNSRSEFSCPAHGAGSGKHPIRVLLADDHPLVRRGLRACLAHNEHLQMVGEAADGQEALSQARALSPDILLMDLDMPGMNGMTATALLRKELPAIKVIIFSLHSHPEFVARILQSDAHGYILKTASPDELTKAIETVHAGQNYFSPAVARLALHGLKHTAAPGSQGAELSNGEREVLIAVAEGLRNKEIASRLGLGIRAVESHRERIMRKLNLHSAAGLTRFAIAEGLVSLPGPSATDWADAHEAP